MYVMKAEFSKDEEVPFNPDSGKLHEVHRGPFSYSDQESESPFFYPPPKSGEVPHHMKPDAISLQLHLQNERRRLIGMTPEEREWRKKYILDQKLHPDEPFYVEEVRMPLNPIRRFYRYPWDAFEQKFLIPKLGLYWGHFLRVFVPKFMLAVFGVGFYYYTLKYNHKTWINRKRHLFTPANRPLLRRDEIEAAYPGYIEKGIYNPQTPKDFYDLGFSRRTSHLDVGNTERPW
ncbi:unnamed protein product [Soboliphyme baturini]|uniref:NADH dehydrogenase [ubiquinone] 1 beta subcomplex subunit 6 n=1 Tax=Soboliphyme baturini TaxID=241478 RepID=A0A183IW81_9BILA|nr:unnamed protein product [Soboliphyme baturini]